MSRGVVAFLIAIGAGTWIYNKLMKYTGNITQKALTGAIASGVVIFIVAYLVFGSIGF